MSMKTIAKFSGFVISIALSAGCSSFTSTETTAANSAAPVSGYSEPRTVGKIASDDVTESSGVAASRCRSDVYWTHNDSGDGAFVYAFNLKGDNLGTWRIPGAENDDWEDIDSYKDDKGKCFLYIGDIGDNKGRRPDHVVYRIPEPEIKPDDVGTLRENATLSTTAQVLKFTYPDGGHNAETMMVNPLTGDIYVLTKRIDGPSQVYKIAGNFDSAGVVSAERVGEVAVPSVPNGLLTGGDISPDGTRVAICDYTQAYELRLKTGSSNFDEIWKEKPIPINVGDLKQNEAIGYTSDGNALVVTSEKKHPPVVEIDRNN
jgi:hypothetical protein